MSGFPSGISVLRQIPKHLVDGFTSGEFRLWGGVLPRPDFARDSPATQQFATGPGGHSSRDARSRHPWYQSSVSALDHPYLY